MIANINTGQEIVHALDTTVSTSDLEPSSDVLKA